MNVPVKTSRATAGLQVKTFDDDVFLSARRAVEPDEIRNVKISRVNDRIRLRSGFANAPIFGVSTPPIMARARLHGAQETACVVDASPAL
jgi:hypothetical protein